VGNAGSARAIAQKKTCHAAEQERADVAAAREAWREAQGGLSIDLSSHKIEGVRTAIEATGAELRYLPPYSPDLNPIEQAFAKLKALLRKIAARSVEALWTAVGQLVDQFAPGECVNYLRHSGYVRSA
jgi:hypothetical protein